MAISGCNPGRHSLISIASDGVTVDEASTIYPNHYRMTGIFDAETKGIEILKTEGVSVVYYEGLLANNYFNIKDGSKTLHYLIQNNPLRNLQQNL